jgi:hypothetical protein
MVGHRWGRTLAPGVVALAALATIATATQAARDRPWAPPACPDDGAARVATARIPAPREPAAIAGEPWFRTDARLDGSGALAGQRLTVGRRGGGAPTTIDLPAESFAAGPFGGLILVGEDDGATSALSTLDPVAGCRSTVDATTDVIRRATVSPDGFTIYEARVARTTRADLGVWSRSLDGVGPSRLVLPPLDPDGRFGRTWATAFTWSAEGDRLAIQSCGAAACRTRLFDPSDGSTTLVDDPALGILVGVAGDRLIAHDACRGFPCGLVATDLVSGARQVLAEDAGPAVLGSDEGTARVIHETVGGADRRLRAVDPDGSTPRDLGTIPDGLTLGGAGGGSDGGIRLPPGWVLLAPDGRLPLAAIDPRLTLRQVRDGRAVRLDEVPR